MFETIKKAFQKLNKQKEEINKNKLNSFIKLLEANSGIMVNTDNMLKSLKINGLPETIYVNQYMKHETVNCLKTFAPVKIHYMLKDNTIIFSWIKENKIEMSFDTTPNFTSSDWMTFIQ